MRRIASVHRNLVAEIALDCWAALSVLLNRLALAAGGCRRRLLASSSVNIDALSRLSRALSDGARTRLLLRPVLETLSLFAPSASCGGVRDMITLRNCDADCSLSVVVSSWAVVPPNGHRTLPRKMQ